MQRIFLTHIVPKDEILEYNLSMAACNFSYSLIESGTFNKVYFILPSFVFGNVKPFKGLVYSILRQRKLFGRFAPIIENIKLFRHIPHNASIWYYNCTILNMTLIILLKLLKPNVKQQMIILDYTPNKKPVERFFLWLTNRMDGTIRLANSPLFMVRNSVCLPGVVPSDDTQYPQIITIQKKFLISGVLGDNIAMLSMLLEAFSEMPQFTLHITGKAPDLNLLEQYTKKHNNIIYHGMVKYAEYLHILHDVSFLLSTRNPHFSENQCNFPSKIIEGLLHNRIVISTLPYKQLDGIHYLRVASDKIDFMKSIQQIGAMPEGELLKYANQANEVRKRFNCEVWKKWMETIENA